MCSVCEWAWLWILIYHVMSLQISDLSVVRKNFGIGFCPERSDVPLAFAESGKLMSDDHVMIM